MRRGDGGVTLCSNWRTRQAGVCRYFLIVFAITETIALGPRATPETIARFAAKMHLDVPIWQQFLIYSGNALTGDLGGDMFSDRPVTMIFSERIGFILALVCAG